MNDSWAAKYYGSDTKDASALPHTTARCSPRGCSRTTDCPIPGTRGLRRSVGLTLASETNQTPAVGAIAWYDGPGMVTWPTSRASTGQIARYSSCRTTTPSTVTATRRVRGPVHGAHWLHSLARPLGATAVGGEKDQASFVASSCATVRSVRSPKRRTTDSSRLARTRGRPRAR